MSLRQQEIAMDDRLKSLWIDLEQYIQENWIAPDKEEPSAAGMLCEESDAPEYDGFASESFEDWGDWTEEDEGPEIGEQDEGFSKEMASPSVAKESLSLEDLIGEVGKPFHEVLFDRISRSGMTDVEVYRRANIDRKLFSKIRSNPAYHPGKNTVLALAIALKMNTDETQDLLSRAEYALSPSSKSDVIIRYFIERRIFDIDLINAALYDHGLAILG